VRFVPNQWRRTLRRALCLTLVLFLTVSPASAASWTNLAGALLADLGPYRLLLGWMPQEKMFLPGQAQSKPDFKPQDNQEDRIQQITVCANDVTEQAIEKICLTAVAPDSMETLLLERSSAGANTMKGASFEGLIQQLPRRNRTLDWVLSTLTIEQQRGRAS